VIVSRDVDEGQTVAASMNAPTLFKIANNLDQMQITANVDEADIGKIKLGLPVEFNVDAYPSAQFSGEVKQIRLNPSSENNVVSYSVIIDAANPDHKLLPGMTTNVTIVIQAKQNVLRIPETATRFKPSKEVWELFGLKWDDELLNAGRNAIMAAMEKARAESASQAKSEPVADNVKSGLAVKPSASAKPLSDSLKTSLTSIRGKRGREGSMAAGNSSFSGAGRRSRTSVVWVLEGKTPQPVPVKTGISDGAFVEVLEGIDSNAIMITGVNYKDAKQATTTNSPTGPGMGRRF
jgi:HlyD family secretion protein